MQGYRLFEALAGRHASAARARAVEARAARDGAGARAAERAHAEATAALVPALMGQVRVLWDGGHYAQAEAVLRGAGDVLGGDACWQMSLAHAVFMGGRFADAVALYEPLVLGGGWDAILDVTGGCGRLQTTTVRVGGAVGWYA